MSGIRVAGVGAVSPAGWSAQRLWEVVQSGERVLPAAIERPADHPNLQVYPVPPLEVAPESWRGPRLRRASPISRYVVAAALEALTEARGRLAPEARLGIVFCTTCGCVRYSRRFFQETLEDPIFASPLIFPETVFNAPASHLAALLGNPARTYTLVGDVGVVAQGMAVGVNWLEDGQVDACLVVAAEETDWILCDAYRWFCRESFLGEGGGALVLVRDGGSGPGLSRITDLHAHAPGSGSAGALRRMVDQLGAGEAGDVLFPGAGGNPRQEAAEAAAWNHWPGKVLSVKGGLGEGLSASAMWQCVAAVQSLRQDSRSRACVSFPGNFLYTVGIEFKNL